VLYASKVAYLQVLFIVLHEMAHLVRGHLAADWQPSANCRETFEWILSLPPNRPHRTLTDADLSELEADFSAVRWLHAMEGRGSDASVFAVLSLLNLLQMFDATASLVFADEDGGDNSVDSEGLSADRIRVGEVLFMELVAEESEKAAYAIYRRAIVMDYLHSLKKLKPADVDFFITKRSYYA
jgi:hypothetical protein